MSDSRQWLKLPVLRLRNPVCWTNQPNGPRIFDRKRCIALGNDYGQLLGYTRTVEPVICFRTATAPQWLATPTESVTLTGGPPS